MFIPLPAFAFQIATFLQPSGASPAGGGSAPAPQQAPMGLPGCGGSQAGGGMSTLMMLLVMFGVLYFLMIRPQQKRQKQHQDMLKALKKGDRVVTNGGLIGIVSALTDKVVTIEIADKVRVNVLRSQVAGLDGTEVEKK